MNEVSIPKHEELKKELMDKFTSTQTYLGSFVKQTVQKTDFKNGLSTITMQKPCEIKVGDVFTSGQDGVKIRPCVVVKVLKNETILYIPITSTENVHCLTPFKSRFFGEGCFCKTINICTKEFVLENFIGVFDNDRAIKTAVKELKQFLNENL